MKKLLVILGLSTLGCLFSIDAKAQFVVDGTFYKFETTDPGWYNIYCIGSGTCGTLGSTRFDGGQYFMASDGNTYIVYPKKLIDSTTPPEDINSEFNNGVKGKDLD